jgi:hypothetical protein
MFACSVTPYSHDDVAKRLLKKLGRQGVDVTAPAASPRPRGLPSHPGPSQALPGPCESLPRACAATRASVCASKWQIDRERS